MLKLNALAQAFFILLTFVCLPVFAMEKEQQIFKQYSNYIKVLGFTTLTSEISEVHVPACTKILVPDNQWNKEQRSKYYASIKNETDSIVAGMLKAYVTMQGMRHDVGQLTLPPEYMCFYPDSNRVEIRDNLGNFTVRGFGEIEVEIRASGRYFLIPQSKYNGKVYPATDRLDGSIPLVHITAHGKTIIIPLTLLKEKYPHELEGTLHIRPDTQARILLEYDMHCFASKVVGAKATPFNPHLLVKNMFKLDTQKLVTNYVLNHDVELPTVLNT